MKVQETRCRRRCRRSEGGQETTHNQLSMHHGGSVRKKKNRPKKIPGKDSNIGRQWKTHMRASGKTTQRPKMKPRVAVSDCIKKNESKTEPGPKFKKVGSEKEPTQCSPLFPRPQKSRRRTAPAKGKLKPTGRLEFIRNLPDQQIKGGRFGNS